MTGTTRIDTTPIGSTIKGLPESLLLNNPLLNHPLLNNPLLNNPSLNNPWSNNPWLQIPQPSTLLTPALALVLTLAVTMLFPLGSGMGLSGMAFAQKGTANAGIRKVVDRPGTYVETKTLIPRDFSLHVTYVGHLLPWERVLLKAEVEGTVEAVDFEEGDAVTPKKELARVSAEQFALHRELAQADLKLAEANFARDKDLARKKLIPAARLDQSRNLRDVAALRIKLADIDVTKSTPHSPIVGFVKTKGVEAGEFVSKGKLIAEILDLRRMRAVFNVPEREVRHLTLGKAVGLRLDALPNAIFAGKVHQVGLEADLKTRTFPVEAVLDNPKGQLRPGMLTRVRVVLAAYSAQMLVPRHAVLEREKGRVVFIASKGRAVERKVRTGVSNAGEVQILAGLNFGDNVIVSGQQKLVPNEPVQIVPRPR